MVFGDYYTINFSFNGTKFELAPQDFSFSLADSIYSLYNYGTFTLNDHDGILQEYFSTTEGGKLTIGYGASETINTCSFIIKKDELSEMSTPGFLTGSVDIELVHDWYGQQKIKSKAYEDSISAIVHRLAVAGGFVITDIENTGNRDLWYQPMITDAKFIQEMVPAAYSPKSNSPFYVYITNDGVFHLKSLQSMMNTKPIATIEYRTQDQKTKNVNQTIYIKRFHQSSDEHRSQLKRNIYQISRTDGSLTTLSGDGIDSYPPKNNKTVPIMNFHDEATGYVDLGFKEASTGRDESMKGGGINSMKKSSFIDRFLVLQQFNPLLKSGELVQLNIYSPEGDGDKISKHYGGKYVVENCEHIWNNEELRGYTKMIIGRKYTGIIPSSYLIKPALI